MIRFDRFRLDIDNERLWAGDQALPLTPKAFSVLTHLARHPGRNLSKEELLDAVWHDSYVSDAVLKVAIREIRKTLDDDARTPRIVETVHRRGYRFVAAIAADRPQAAPTVVPAIVGREAALETLGSLLARAAEGQRQVAFVAGEPGIGKTTLVEAFLGHAEHRGSWLASGHCLEQFGSGEPYLPVLEALGRLCHDPHRDTVVSLLRSHAPTWLLQMPSLVDSDDREQLQRETLGATPQRMLREMAEAIEVLTERTPLVLVLEDLHWSDYATLDLVSLLARRPEKARLLVIVTYRPADAQLRKHPLLAVRRELETHRQCRQIHLDYLTEAAVASYLEQRFPSADLPAVLGRKIQVHTNGNPLFMVNVVDYLVAEGQLREDDGRWRLEGQLEDIELGVPEGIRQLVERQIERLDERQQRVLEAASVAGGELAAAAVADALAIDPIDVEETCDRLVERHQFLRAAAARSLPDGSLTARYAFIHSLYQQILYQRIPDARRRRLHLRIAEGGERTFGARAQEIAAELAVHFEEARETSRAVSYLRLAAATAARRYAHREAADYLTRALFLIETWPNSEASSHHLELLRQRGMARRAMGDMQGAAEDFEQLVRKAHLQGAVEAEIQALLFLTSALYWIRRERCLEVVDQAAARSQELANEHLRAHIQGYCAHWYLNLRGWRQSDATACRQALAAARQAQDRELISLHVVRDVYLRCWQADYDGAGRAAAEGLELASSVGDVFDYLVCKFFWVWALLHAGQWGRIGPILSHGIDLAEKNGHPLWALMFRIELAWLHEQAFDHEEALRLCRPAVERARRDPQQTGQLLFKSLIVMGFACLGLGRREEAFDCFAEVLRVIDEQRVSMDCLLYLPLRYGLGRYWLERGHLDEARQEAEALCELASEPGEMTYLALGRLLLVEMAIEEEREAAAEAQLAVIAERLDDERAPLAAWRVHAVSARLHRRLLRDAQAADATRRGNAVLARLADTLGDANPLSQYLLTRATGEHLFA